MTAQKVAVLVAVAAAFLLLCHGADALLPAFKHGSKINQFCKTADSKRLCTRMVGGASNLHDASANAIKATLKLAKEMEAKSSALIPSVSKLKRATQDSILKTCRESFNRAIDDLQISLQSLGSADHGTVMIHLSAALSSDCEDALKEFGVKNFPLQNTVKVYDRYLDSTMAVVTQQ